MNLGGDYTLPENNELHLKVDGWNTSFLLGCPIFRCCVSFRECIYIYIHIIYDIFYIIYVIYRYNMYHDGSFFVVTIL